MILNYRSSIEVNYTDFKIVIRKRALLRLRKHSNVIGLYGIASNTSFESFCQGPALIMELANCSLYSGRVLLISACNEYNDRNDLDAVSLPIF